MIILNLLNYSIQERLPSAGGISDGGLNPATDTSKLLTAYRGGSHILSDISIILRIPVCGEFAENEILEFLQDF